MSTASVEQAPESIDVRDIPAESTMTSKEAEEHLEAVRKQIEYYFSKENLQNDPYLASQMDANKSVPISIIMRFAKLKQLTQDEQIVRQSLKSSSVVALVEDRIRVIAKPGGRSTLILREIPSDATEDEIREIFNFEGCKPIQSLHPDIENTWFVVMESEEDVKDTVLDLQMKKRLFRGEKVKARVKTETSIRSFFPVLPVPPIAPVLYPTYPGMYSAMGVPVDMRSYPYIPTPPVTAIPIAPSSPSLDSDSGKEGNGNGLPKDRSSENQVPNGVDRKSRRTDYNKDRKMNNGLGTGQGQTYQRRDGRKVRNYDRKDGKSTTIEIDAINFPPLGVNSHDDSPVPTPGFKGEVIKYTFDDVINIVKNVRDAKLPEDLRPEDHPIAMTVSPNLDLLQRQRTFSIDETREQLQQGRPVQRLAVKDGEVDYGSMMYGDGYAPSEPKPIELPKTTEGKSPSTTWAALVAQSSGNDSQSKNTSTNGHFTVKVDQTAKKSASVGPVSPTKKPSNANAASPAKSDQSKSPTKDNQTYKKAKPVVQNHNESSAPTIENVVSQVVETLTQTTEKVVEDIEASIAAVPPSDAPTATTSTVKASTWGGKPTFANILKQQIDSSVPVTVTATKPMTDVQSATQSVTETNHKKPHDKKHGKNVGKRHEAKASDDDNWRRNKQTSEEQS